MNKKKIILTLLASASITASAAGLTACTPSSENYDSTLYNLYTTYREEAENNGDTAQTYEDWLYSMLNNIGEQGEQGDPGKGVKDVKKETKDGTEYFVFEFTDGSTVEIPIK